ncbi:hypothetical protein Goarm_016320 [Gossypium armourianum]|uniref:Uncharacterized protein n=1 Tax=Gossypium armourianum TaxID=34283 RepID=A0A7J9JBU4_9ROSI|nr:hypothetical protein [Gossypium armourianum]
MGSVITAANVEQIPGLNTLARFHYQPGGLNPVIFVLDGKLDNLVVNSLELRNIVYFNTTSDRPRPSKLEPKESIK